MESIRRAVIDVGTNSVKLLVADVAGRDVRPVHEESRQTRLGRGFYETHRLRPEAIACTAEAIWDFANTAREKDCRLHPRLCHQRGARRGEPGGLDGHHSPRVRTQDGNHLRRAGGRSGFFKA